MATCKRLDNGLTVIVEENRFAPVVSLQCWVNVGSADETDAEAGLAHVHEHMVFKGTPRRGVGQIAREVEGAGGDINAYTSFEQTVYYITMASRYFETGLDVLADAVQHAVFDPVELAKELAVILEEVKRSNDHPVQRLSTELFQTAYRAHPFRRPIIGYEETIRGFTREAVLSFFHRYYVPANMLFVVAGDVDEARALAAVERAFAGRDGRQVTRPPRAPEPAQTEARSLLLFQPVNEAYLDMAFHIPGLLHPDTPALDLLSVILGSGESSRFFRQVKAKKDLVHTASASAYSPLDPGLFVVGATLEPAKADRAVAALLEEIGRAGAGTITADELDKARRNVETDFLFERETVQGQARRLGFSYLVSGALDFEERYLEKIRAVTREDLARVAHDHLRPENLTVGLLAAREWEGRIEGARLREAAALGHAKGARTRACPRGARMRVATGRAAAPRKAPRLQREETGGIARLTFPNGMRLLFKRNPAAPLVSLRAVFLGGTRMETEETQGISHFVAEMLTKGTLRRSDERLAREVEALGGTLKGFSGRNSMGVTADFLARDFPRSMELVADVIRNPVFPEEQMERKRADILFQLSRREDELSRYVFDLFCRELYRTHPFRYPALGSPSSISAITRDALREHYARLAMAENLVLAVVGDLEEGDVVGLAQRWLGGLPGGGFRPPLLAPEPPPAEIRRTVLIREKEQAHVVLGFLGASLTDPDRFAVEALNSILAGQGGRLFVRLRDELHLAYAVTSLTIEGLEPGFLAVYIGTSPQNVEVAIENILDQLERIRSEPVPEEELARVKRYLIGSFETDLQTNAAQASAIGFGEAYGLGFTDYLRYPERIAALSVEDVAAAARRILRTDAYTLAIIRP